MAIQLPSITTVEGVVARLLLAESSSPSFPLYDKDQAQLGMYAMKAVVDNRLNNYPAQFNAPGAVNYSDIITAPGQFYGFSRNAAGNLVIAANVQQRIDALLRIANSNPSGDFATFVTNAITVANSCVNDPFAGVHCINGIAVTGGAYGWRTVNATDSGGRFVPIPASLGGIIQGNKFYTLKP